LRRLLIAGPGRSGTTALVRILAEVGLSTTADTGRYFDDARAGYEGGLTERSPAIVKSPHLTFQLPQMLADGTVNPADLLGVVLPVRDLDQVAGSRTANALRLGSPRGPGALFGTTVPTRQADVLARGLIDLVLALEAHDVDHTFLLYPRFTADFDYLWSKIAGFLPGTSRTALQEAWDRCIDARLTRTSYAAPTSADDAALAQGEAEQRGP
jgi:hypothetical protein